MLRQANVHDESRYRARLQQQQQQSRARIHTCARIFFCVHLPRVRDRGCVLVRTEGNGRKGLPETKRASLDGQCVYSIVEIYCWRSKISTERACVGVFLLLCVVLAQSHVDFTIQSVAVLRLFFFPANKNMLPYHIDRLTFAYGLERVGYGSGFQSWVGVNGHFWFVFGKRRQNLF